MTTTMTSLQCRCTRRNQQLCAPRPTGSSWTRSPWAQRPTTPRWRGACPHPSPGPGTGTVTHWHRDSLALSFTDTVTYWHHHSQSLLIWINNSQSVQILDSELVLHTKPLQMNAGLNQNNLNVAAQSDLDLCFPLQSVIIQVLAWLLIVPAVSCHLLLTGRYLGAPEYPVLPLNQSLRTLIMSCQNGTTSTTQVHFNPWLLNKSQNCC